MPECEAPTTSTGPGCSWAGRRYSLECSCRIAGSSSPASNSGTFGVRPKLPVATTTVSQLIVLAPSGPRVATYPPSGPGTSRSIRVLVRTGRSQCRAYASR